MSQIFVEAIAPTFYFRTDSKTLGRGLELTQKTHITVVEIADVI